MSNVWNSNNLFQIKTKNMSLVAFFHLEFGLEFIFLYIQDLNWSFNLPNIYLKIQLCQFVWSLTVIWFLVWVVIYCLNAYSFCLDIFILNSWILSFILPKFALFMIHFHTYAVGETFLCIVFFFIFIKYFYFLSYWPILFELQFGVTFRFSLFLVAFEEFD